MKKIQLSSLLLLASISGISPMINAGTAVEIQSEGVHSTILTDGRMARMGSGDNEYVIVDYKNNRVAMVSPQKKQVLQLDAKDGISGKDTTAVKVSFRPLGNGRVVAGFKTQKYDYQVNGKSCGVIYGSQDAYQQKGIKELVQAMQTMMEKQQAMLGGFAGLVDECTQADMQIANHVKAVGIPMLTEKNGRVESEITSIRTDVALPANTFVIPPSYRRVTLQEMMKQSMAGMGSQPAAGNQQQMQEMMRQMRQSGQMTPEMMEQMRQAQQMMMRYQNQ